MEYRCINVHNRNYLYILIDEQDKSLLYSLAPSIKTVFECAENEKKIAIGLLKESAKYLLLEIIRDAARETGVDNFIKSDAVLCIEIHHSPTENFNKINAVILKVYCEYNAQSNPKNQSNYEQIKSMKNEKNSERRKIKIQRKKSEMIYCFSDFFDAKDCISALIKQKINPQVCVLFQLGNHYLIKLSISAQSRGICRKILSEFGEKKSNDFLPILDEHGSKICADFYNEVKNTNSEK